jgi:DNA-binding XRE family transcriptional regulator
MTTVVDSCPLREERLRQGFSQSELAQEAGLTRETVSRLERGCLRSSARLERLPTPPTSRWASFSRATAMAGQARAKGLPARRGRRPRRRGRPGTDHDLHHTRNDALAPLRRTRPSNLKARLQALHLSLVQWLRLG